MPDISKPASADGNPAPLRRWGATAVVLGLAALVVFGARLFVRPGPETHRVVIENMKFSPEEIEIPLGDRVEFVNRDLVPHTATAQSGQMFDSELIAPGAAWGFSPGRAGVIGYRCKFHPMMEGRVVIRAR